MGYWIIADENGQYVSEADTYEQAETILETSPIANLQIIPYFDFYNL